MTTYGPAFEHDQDEKRLCRQMDRVRNHMLAAAIRGRWETLTEIREALETDWNGQCFPEASISAQLRHLRKAKFGCYKIEKRRRGIEAHGLWEYKLIPSRVDTAPAPGLLLRDFYSGLLRADGRA